jgi:pimeloyl-ACP methyl ester carboxylesterase
LRKLFQKATAKTYGLLLNILVLAHRKKAASWAFRMFCKVRKGKVKPHQIDYLNQAKTPPATLENHQIQPYHWPGKGATVLLVHGWESNSFRWRNLVTKLQSEKFNVLAFDAPGHGYSSGEYLNLILYAKCLNFFVEKYQPIAIVAHSMGGMTTMYHEAHYPTPSIKKIVTTGAPSELEGIVQHFRKIVGFNTNVLKALDDYFKDHFGFTIEEFSISALVKNNKKSGLLIHDVEDKVVPVEASKRVHRQWTNSKIILTKGLGHSLHQQEINEHIVDFIKN